MSTTQAMSMLERTCILALILLSGAFVLFLAWHYFRDTIYDKAAANLRTYLTNSKPIGPGKVPGHIWEVVHELRAELGLLSHTKANALVVSNRARAIMKSRDMRTCDISLHHPTVVAIYFMKTEGDEFLEFTQASRYYRGVERRASPY